MKHNRVFPVIFFILLLSSAFLYSDARSEWEAFGKKFRNKFPNDLQKKSIYLAGLVGEAMAQEKILPNYDHFGRARAYRQHGNQGAGTCGDIAEIMRAVFKGAGFQNHQIFKIVVKKDLANTIKSGWVFDNNIEHTVFGVVVNGKPIVFEQWAYGGENGSFQGFYKSVWNGMDLDVWLKTMKKYGYRNYSFGDSNIKPININDIYILLRKIELINSGRIPRKRPRRIRDESMDDTIRILIEFRNLYPQWLKKNLTYDKEEKGEVVVTANAVKIGPNQYRVANEIWRTPRFGLKKGKKYRSGSASYVWTISQIKAALKQYKRDLNIK